MSASTLREALATVRIMSANRFALLGREEEAASLIDGLAESLYAHLHCRMPLDSRAVPAFASWAGVRDFVERLSQANSGCGCWQEGWMVRGREADERLIVERRGVRYWASPGDLRDASALQAGDEVVVRLPREYRDMVPGFYLALGNTDDVRDTTPIVRVYWNVAARGAPGLIGALTRELNQSGISFQLKALTEPLRYDRVDPVVLYLPRHAYRRTLPLLATVHRSARKWLRAPVSLLVQPIGPGVGVAEDPGDGSSFGEHRTRMLARLLIERPGRLEEELAGLGYSLDALYRNPGSPEVYPPFEYHDD